jgi:hypothetical protein
LYDGIAQVSKDRKVFTIHSKGISDTFFLSTKANILWAAENGFPLVLTFHKVQNNVNDGLAINPANFTTLIEYALSLGLKFYTVDELFRHVNLITDITVDPSLGVEVWQESSGGALAGKGYTIANDGANGEPVLVITDPTANAMQTFPVNPGQSYKFRTDWLASVTSGNLIAEIWVQDTAGAVLSTTVLVTIDTTKTQNTWQRSSQTITMPANAFRASLRLTRSSLVGTAKIHLPMVIPANQYSLA